MAAFQGLKCAAAATPTPLMPEASHDHRDLQSLRDLPVTVHVGGPLEELKVRPLPPYSPQALALLGEWSRSLLSSTAAKKNPDIATFAYWSRPANLKRLASAFPNSPTRVGRGLALHIAPANVPVNFAYSLAFGILAGCANIVRVPDAFAHHLAIMGQPLIELLTQPEHEHLADMNRLVSYPRDSHVTPTLSALCQARLIWGGDQTVARLRAMPTRPRCVDVAFSDRYSLCLLDAQAVLNATDADLHRLVIGFYNDTYLLDQNACSSPHLVLWQGHADRIRRAQDRFWPRVHELVKQKYEWLAVHAVDKYTLLCRQATRLPDAAPCIQHGNLIYRLPVETLPSNLSAFRGSHGLFFEHTISHLESLRSIVDDKYQTLCTFGIDNQQTVEQLVSLGFGGIDRVVPIGQALNMGVIWDGYDVIATLSRIVAIQ